MLGLEPTDRFHPGWTTLMRIAGSGIPAATVASCNRDILSVQSLIHRQRKITPHLNPVLVPIRPRLKWKAHSTGSEVNNIRLRCWFFRYVDDWPQTLFNN